MDFTHHANNFPWEVLMGLQSDLQMNRQFCFRSPTPFWGPPFRGIFCRAGIMERQRGTQEEGFRCVWIDSDILLSVIVHGPFIPLHSSSRFIHNRSAVSFTRGWGRDLCVLVCVWWKHMSGCVFLIYCAHKSVYTVTLWDELPPRDEVKVKSLARVQETIG